jgi:hypothetical protein
MKQFAIFLTVWLGFSYSALFAQELSPYIKVGVYKNNLNVTFTVVQTALEKEGFKVIGSYSPEDKSTLKVMAYTREDLQMTTLKIKDRGALASVLKVGFKTTSSGTTITYLNPLYLFNAYLRDEFPKYEDELNIVAQDVERALSALGSENRPFGGSIEVSELKDYRYKALMPKFDDKVNLKTFTSFDEGIRIIESNLAAGKGKTKLVFKEVFKTEKVAVFGVALLDPKTGEGHFLPIIGEEHIAAMPYEIILQDKQATMLHGRFRIALHWPDLTMGTFMKIMSTPGDIESTLKALCQ